MNASTTVRALRRAVPGDHPADVRVLLELDLSRGLTESPPTDPVRALRQRQVPQLSAVVTGLRLAARDPDVAGLVVCLGPHDLTVAQSEELGRAVEAFRAAGKTALCWTESFGELGPGTVPYYLASHFDEIWLQPSGRVGLVGVAASAVFVRGALDKLGVQPQIGQRHEYKSAADMLLREDMSAHQREMLQQISDSVVRQVVHTVAAGRGLTEATVLDAVEAGPLSGPDAVSRGLVDRLGYRDEAYDDLRSRLTADDEELRPLYVDRYARSKTRRPGSQLRRRRRPTVAIVSVHGPINRGRSGSARPMSGPTVGSETVCAALRAARHDDHVKAVVLRVDSPGGSYVASDAIRREVVRTRESGRPLVASMASVAASGGYFVSMAADAIVALPGTITGSIGVLGGKQVVRDALARVGINRESVSAGRRAAMFSTDRPFDDEEWQVVEAWLDEVYADFTTKAAQDRAMAYEDLERHARGRVWTGADALARGLVDEMGGLDRAVEIACARAGLERDRVNAQAYPQVPLLQRIRPPESSAAAAACQPVAMWEGAPLGAAELMQTLSQLLGVPTAGALTLPGRWRMG